MAGLFRVDLRRRVVKHIKTHYGYSLWTLLLLMAIVPPVVGFWPDIKRHTLAKATCITASDVAVAVAASTLVLTRLYVTTERNRLQKNLGHSYRVGLLHLTDAYITDCLSCFGQRFESVGRRKVVVAPDDPAAIFELGRPPVGRLGIKQWFRCG